MCRALIASAVATALLACGARTELDRGTDAGMCEWHFGTAIPLVRDLESTPDMSSGGVRRDRDIALVYWRDGHGHVGGRSEVELSEPPRILRESPSSPTEARWVAGAPLGWTEIMLDGERAVMRSADGEVVLELSRPPLSFVETGASVDLVIIGPSGGLELVSLVDGVELERESLQMWHANPRAIRVAAREWIVLGNPGGSTERCPRERVVVGSVRSGANRRSATRCVTPDSVWTWPDTPSSDRGLDGQSRYPLGFSPSAPAWHGNPSTASRMSGWRFGPPAIIPMSLVPPLGQVVGPAAIDHPPRSASKGPMS